MSDRWGFLILYVVYIVGVLIGVEGLGVNWGTIASHKLDGKIVVQMLKDNGIKKVKLFDSDESSLKALGGSGIEVMVGIPNGQIEKMNSYDHAKDWVKSTIMDHGYNGGANITYVAVGNEPFLEAYNNTYLNTTLPALKNIQTALNEVGLRDTVKATIPFNADVYNSPPFNPVPSAGRFRPDVTNQITQIIKFLDQNKSPFIVNIYPFLSLYYGSAKSQFPLDYAFFDGSKDPVVDKGVVYNNAFDANYDTCVAALEAVGYGNMTVIVGEIGWPTDGDKYANVDFASRFYKGLLKNIAKGTAKRPGYIEVYLFGLLDEDAKNVAPGNFERHWGIFTYDGRVKFEMDLLGSNKSLVPAQGVVYQPKKWCQLNPKAKDLSKVQDYMKTACEAADCTSLGYGCSCNGLDEKGNASYAFNAYFQVNNQKESSCDFGGLGTITTQNISQGNCNFTIQLVAPSGQPPVVSLAWSSVVALPVLTLIALLLDLLDGLHVFYLI